MFKFYCRKIIKWKIRFLSSAMIHTCYRESVFPGLFSQKMIRLQESQSKQDGSFFTQLELSLQLEKEEMKNPRLSRKKEIIKIRAEINEKETKETIAKIKKLKAGSLRR